MTVIVFNEIRTTVIVIFLFGRVQKSLEVKEDLHSAQFLIIKNPKWGISLIGINDDNEETVEVLDTLVNIFTYAYQSVSLS